MENVKLTKLWIERFVIGLRLCPFAHFSFYGDTIYYDVTSATKLIKVRDELMALAQKMYETGPSEISNAFLIFDESLSFDFMLLAKEKFDAELMRNGLEEKFQTVVFHPEFQFGDEDFHAPGNFTNRSPLPMIHMLRIDEVAHAIEVTENVDDIPFRNKEVLEKLNIKKISEVFDDDFMELIKPYI